MLLLCLLALVGGINAGGLSVQLYKTKTKVLQGNFEILSRDNRDSQNVDLECTHMNLNYGIITIGTKPESTSSEDFDKENSFKMLFDIGSHVTWVTGLKNPNREDSNYYKMDHSKRTGYELAIQYSGGTTKVKGIYYVDRVCIDKFCMNKGIIGVATHFEQFRWPIFEGIFGLGYYKGFDLSDIKTSVRRNQFSLFARMLEINKFNEIFGLQLNRRNGKLTIGGIDENFISANFTWFKVPQHILVQDIQKPGLPNKKRNSHWFIQVNKISLLDLEENLTIALLDSGNEAFMGPARIVHAVWRKIGVEYGLFDCQRISLMPYISIEMADNLTVELSPDDYVIKNYYEGCDISEAQNISVQEAKKHFPEGMCHCGFFASNTIEYFIFGDTFLRKVYTVFDLGQSRVGFASLNDAKQ